MTLQKADLFTHAVRFQPPGADPDHQKNVIATLRAPASPERFYVLTRDLDSRVTDVLNFTDDAPGC